jgi:hypothetical protein
MRSNLVAQCGITAFSNEVRLKHTASSHCLLQVDQDSEGNAVLVCPPVEPGCLYPEEVSTCVLAQLLADASRHTGRQVSKAVITVPAYFSDEQREATVAAGACCNTAVCRHVVSHAVQLLALQQCTSALAVHLCRSKLLAAVHPAAARHSHVAAVGLLAAGKLAGLETVRLIREPVAAALAYGLDLTEEQVGCCCCCCSCCLGCCCQSSTMDACRTSNCTANSRLCLCLRLVALPRHAALHVQCS